jgi:hypothetical protein
MLTIEDIEERARTQPAQKTNRPIDPAVAAATAGRFIAAERVAQPSGRKRRWRQYARGPPSDDACAASKALPLALRYREAAELIGVSVRQIHNLANAGLLKRVRIGKRCGRITTASVIELIGE